MKAENRSGIMPAFSETAFTYLLGLPIPEKIVVNKGEFQLRIDDVTGQTLGTLRDRTNPHIGHFLRPGKFIVLAYQERNSRIIARDIKAFSHAHAARRARRIANRQSGPCGAEVISLRTPRDEKIAEVIDSDFTRRPQRTINRQFANNKVVYGNFKHEAQETADEQIINAEVLEGDFAHGPQRTINRQFANDKVVPGDSKRKVRKTASYRAKVIHITSRRHKVI